MIEQGYDGSYNGEAYGSVMYQNENLSVRAGDEFMQAAIDGKEWWTQSHNHRQTARKEGRGQARSPRSLKARGLAATPACNTTVRSRNGTPAPVPKPIHSTNPCSEYVFLNNTACNLASLNLMKFKREDGKFDIERFKAAVRIYITAQEILVDNACYPTKEIAENSHIYRTLGLGFANLGSLCMSYGLPYDSDEGRALAGAITAIMTGHAYEQSLRLPPWKDHSRVTAMRVAPASPRPSRRTTSSPCSMSSSCIAMPWKTSSRAQSSIISRPKPGSAGIRLWRAAKQVGYRNAQVTVLAPTGTIAFLMDCDTTGVEPDIALVKYKLLAGGGMLKIVNRTVPEGLRRLGYNQKQIEAIITHVEKFDTIEDVEENGATIRSGVKAEHLPVFDCAFKAFRGKRSIGYLAHLKMMARGPAVHQRRDLQDRQHAQRLHGRRHPQHLRGSVEDGPQVRRHLS
ncbi:MAG: hypothetical protein QM813_07140 [Verrucomicrobiota bacterium]